MTPEVRSGVRTGVGPTGHAEWVCLFALFTLIVALFVASFQQATAEAKFGFIDEWGQLGDSEGEFLSPYGIAVSSVGNVYVAGTSNDRIQVFDSSGGFIEEWGERCVAEYEEPRDPIECDGGFHRPEGIAVDAASNVYVADTFNNRIQKFRQADEGYEYERKWGRFCDVAYDGPIGCNGWFNHQQGISVSSIGNVYIADTINHRIQEFGSTGEYHTWWGSYCDVVAEEPRNCNKGLRYPEGIAANTDGIIYVADTGNDRIQMFNSHGAPLRRWGSDCFVHDEDPGTCDGKFNAPSGIAVDVAGNVYVADTGNNRIQVFDPSGVFIKKWGSEGSGDGQFLRPKGIAVDYAGNVYVADTFNHRIQKFGQLPDSEPPPQPPPQLPSQPTTPPPLSPTPQPPGSPPAPADPRTPEETDESACSLKITSPRVKTGKSRSARLSRKRARRLFTKGLKGYIRWGKVGGKNVVCENLKVAILEKRGKRFFLPGSKTRVSKKYLSSKSFPTKGARFLKKKKAGKLTKKRQLRKRQTKFAFKPFSRRSRIGRRALRSLKKKGYRGTFVVLHTAKVGNTTVKETMTLKVSGKK